MDKLKVFNRNHLKIIAVIAMTMDHFAQKAFEIGSVSWTVFRMIGRIALPVMVYFLVEGFIHTHNLKKYILRLFLFSIVGLFSFSFFETGSFLPVQFVPGTVTDYPYTTVYFSSLDVTMCLSMFSIITTLLLSLLTLSLWEKTKWKTPVKVLLTVLAIVLSFNCDWLYVPILMALCFYYLRNNKCAKWIVYLAISALCIFNVGITSDVFKLERYIDIRFVLYRIGMILPLLLIELFYNGEPGRKTTFGKWFFYVFYPAHQIILGWIFLLK